METSSDEQLLTCIASGDRVAFAEFYDRHAPRVFALLLKQLGQRGDAEDVLQEIFWQVWSRAGQFDAARAPPLVWLLLIARSRALDKLRQQRRAAAPAVAKEAATISDPGRALEDGERAQQLRAALTKLPEEQRRAICLAFYLGLTYEEVAQQQGVPLGTAKTRIRLGMRRLRDLLSDQQ